MSWNWNSHGLPFLPGYTFRDVTLMWSHLNDLPLQKSAFHRPQSMTYKNGYALARRPTVGIGQDPLLSEQLIQDDINELSIETQDMTYGSLDQGVVGQFVPAYVALDKKVLRFDAYFREEDALFRVRPVVIYYYLEDDSMCIIEPKVENSGTPQGKRVKRHRLPKNEHGDHHQWKDLNIGKDLEVYGVKYHITQCDTFTKEFLESEGIVLNDPEPMPEDPSSKCCRNPQPPCTMPSGFDQKHQFLTMDGKVLRFFALWDNTDSLYGETRQVIFHYYLVDHTLEVREVHEPNSGRDPFPVMMRRQKLPRKMKPEAETFPSCVLEVSTAEVEEYYSPKDFQVGQVMELRGRRFRLYDCDGFTKEYYRKNHPDMEMKPSELPKKADLQEQQKPKRPKEKPKVLENDHKVLRYSARLDSKYPEDEGRHFILSYFLSNDTLSIFETPSSGIITGQFLKKTRIPKPGSTEDDPEFYSPGDFAIGATVEVFSHRFVLTDADNYVLTYLESNASQIPRQTLDSLQKLRVGTANSQLDDQKGDDVAEPSS